MPRTKFRKQPLTKINEKESIESSITKTNFTAKFEKKLTDCIADLQETRDRYLAQIDKKERELKIIFKFDLHKTLGQMKNESSDTSIDSHQSVLQNSCDEGYLTTESSEYTSKTSKVTFNTTSSNSTMNLGNMSAFKTPMVNCMSKEAALAAGYITPKVKPNRPLTVLRRAQPGEMVVSMTGSPVLVQAIDAERPNVNVPLADGRIISVQPQNSIRRSEIPEIDETTRKYLQTLRDNLDKIVNHVK